MPPPPSIDPSLSFSLLLCEDMSAHVLCSTFTWGLGLNLGGQACVARAFISWAISPVLSLFFDIGSYAPQAGLKLLTQTLSRPGNTLSAQSTGAIACWREKLSSPQRAGRGEGLPCDTNAH